MFNLEQRIAEWRKLTMTNSGMPPETLDELESHLRETIEQLVQSGVAEVEAFRRAVAQLGTAPAIAFEFQKLNEPIWAPIKVAIGTGVAVALGLAIVLITRLDDGRVSFLLASHVFTVTLGYTITFLVGGLGLCFVGQRCFGDFSPLRARSLTRVTFTLGCIAAALTAVGIILAMIWAKAEWGRYWAWDAKETGGFSVIVWLACFLFAHRFRGGGARSVLVMSVLGNIVVTLAWFGANLIGGFHRFGTLTYSLLLLTAVALNLAFFLIGLAPAGWLRLRKT